MKTPITDGLWDQTKGIPEFHAKLEDVARRLETDRAALIKALEKIAALPWDYNLIMDAGWVMRDIRITLAAVRANFPQP